MLNSIKIISVCVFIIYQIVYSKFAPDHNVIWASWYYILLFGSFGTVLINLKTNIILGIILKYGVCFFYLQVLRYFYLIGLHYEAWYHSNFELGWWEFKIGASAGCAAIWLMIEKWKK